MTQNTHVLRLLPFFFVFLVCVPKRHHVQLILLAHETEVKRYINNNEGTYDKMPPWFGCSSPPAGPVAVRVERRSCRPLAPHSSTSLSHQHLPILDLFF